MFHGHGNRSTLDVIAGHCAHCEQHASLTASPSEDESASASPSADTSAGGNGICLNTAEEVSQIVGVEVGEPVSVDVADAAGACNYPGPDGQSIYAIAVFTSTAAADALAGAKNTPGAVSVSGLGDEAVHVPPRGPLVVRVDDTVVSLGFVI